MLTAYELTHQSMQQYIVNTHTEWFNTIDNSISKQLQANLLVQDKADREFLGGGSGSAFQHSLVRYGGALSREFQWGRHHAAECCVPTMHCYTNLAVCDQFSKQVADLAKFQSWSTWAGAA